MAQSKWIYGGGAVLLTGLIVWAVTSVPEIPQQTDEPTGPRIMSYMDNTLHEERDGRTIWQMTAEQMNVDIDTNDTGMVKIDGTFYSDDGRTLTLKVKYGDFSIASRSTSQLQEILTLEEIQRLGLKLLRGLDYTEHPVRLLGLTISNPSDELRPGMWVQQWIQFPD